ncbi:MAG: hypothetical protein WA347_02860 [Rhabdochlamydiaceae bacterium]
MSTILPTGATNGAQQSTTQLQHPIVREHYTAGVSTLDSMRSAAKEEAQIPPLIEGRNRKIVGVELVVKSVAAGLLGIVPFLTSKVGEAVVKGCAYIAQEGKKSLNRFGSLGVFTGEALRVILGIPALLGGSLLFGGALIFSKVQALVWGRELIKHPQEEKINTQLARYGAGSKPWNDFVTFIGGFSIFSNSQKADASLWKIRHFKAT